MVDNLEQFSMCVIYTESQQLRAKTSGTYVVDVLFFHMVRIKKKLLVLISKF